MNQKKNWKWMIGVIICISLILILSNITPVLADVGNNNRYEETTSDTDGSGIFSMITWLLFGLFGPVPALILIGIALFFYFKWKKSGKLGQIQRTISEMKTGLTTIQQMDGTLPSHSPEEVINEIQQIDPAFSKDAFLGWAGEVFIKIQQAWSNRDWHLVRPFESNELFSQHVSQLQEYINQNKINQIEKISISYSELREFKQDGDKETLVIELHSVMRDYVIDATTKKVLEGNQNQDYRMKYLMTFQRKLGVKTHVGTSNRSTTNCPNCGAPTQITSSGQCSYCDSVITTGEHDWVLSNIRTK